MAAYEHATCALFIVEHNEYVHVRDARSISRESRVLSPLNSALYLLGGHTGASEDLGCTSIVKRLNGVIEP